MNVCFELFMQDQLKVLKQFEAKVYISFRVVALVCKSEILKKVFMAQNTLKYNYISVQSSL